MRSDVKDFSLTCDKNYAFKIYLVVRNNVFNHLSMNYERLSYQILVYFLINKLESGNKTQSILKTKNIEIAFLREKPYKLYTGYIQVFFIAYLSDRIPRRKRLPDLIPRKYHKVLSNY